MRLRKVVALERAIEKRVKLGRMRGLFEIVVGAFADRGDCRFRLRVRRYHDTDEIGFLFAQLPEHIEAGHAAEMDVEHHHHRAEARHQGGRLLRIGDGGDLESARFQQVHERAGELLIVVDEENTPTCRGYVRLRLHGGTPAGR